MHACGQIRRSSTQVLLCSQAHQGKPQVSFEKCSSAGGRALAPIEDDSDRQVQGEHQHHPTSVQVMTSRDGGGGGIQDFQASPITEIMCSLRSLVSRF